MSYSQLRAFHAVAAAGSFTGAARALNVTQPTLSGQVSALEAAYGVKLFERRGRGIEPTEIGRALNDVCRRFFAAEAEAEQLLAGARGLIGGQLRVGADAPYHVLPLVATFTRRFPGTRLALSFGNSEELLRALYDRQSDVAVLPDLKPDPRLHSRPLKRDRLIAFVERGHPWARRRWIRMAELAEQRLVLREAGSTTRAVFEKALKKTGVKPREAIEIGSREAVREAVAAGLGVGIVAESEFGNDERLARLEVRGAELATVEYAACLAERRESRVVAAFFDLIGELYPAA
ncbi:MAG: LysR substrate-binding domain-containing protein [Kiloniellales bacterium]